ncbi:MAG: fucose isomerase [Angelakisella sp.]
MKNKLNVGFITTVSGRWPRELPNKRLKEYGEWLSATLPEVNLIKFDSIIDSGERIEMAIDSLKKQDVDLVVILYGAFTGDDVCTAIADRLHVPMIMWAPHEPELGGGRLLANALVALTMNSASLHRLGHKSYPIYGDKEEAEVESRIKSLVTAYSVIKSMKQTLFGLFGYRPTAFYNCAFDEGLIRRTFGIRIEETDLKVVFDRMAELEAELVLTDRDFVKKTFHLLETLPELHYDNHTRLYLSLKELMAKQGYDFATIKCWPEMGDLRTTPCAVLGRLADDGVHIGCEGDVDAALAMVAQNYITGKPTFITDLIDINEESNYMTFWHCGNAAPSLHNTQYDTVMGNHPLAGQGTAFHTTLKEGPVTVARFCNIGGVYKLLLIRGTAIKTDLYTPGSMVNIQTNTPVKEIIYGMIERGVPHHYSIVWEDVADIMITIAKILGIEVIAY